LSPPHNERDERDTASPALGADMNGSESESSECDSSESDSSESDSSESDSERTVLPQLVEDEVFNAYCEQANGGPPTRGAKRALTHAAVVTKESKLASISACREAANFECKCQISCALRSKAMGAIIQQNRRGTLADHLYDGSRLKSLARCIQSSMTDVPTHLHPDNPRKNRDGRLTQNGLPLPKRQLGMRRTNSLMGL
jgi:hypothetical protein